jgi:PD-(D/E)XK nuclease superfamily protein
MGPNLKGAIAEAEIAAAAIKIGIPVLRPMAEHGRYDLALELGGQILRVQCKWGALHPRSGVIKVNLQTSSCTPAGYIIRAYEDDEIDLLAVYCSELDRCYLLPSTLVRAGARSIYVLRPLGMGNGRALILHPNSNSLGL